jgi:hypothetical protein
MATHAEVHSRCRWCPHGCSSHSMLKRASVRPEPAKPGLVLRP